MASFAVGVGYRIFLRGRVEDDMKQAYFSRTAFTLSAMMALLLAAAPGSSQGTSLHTTVSIVSDASPGPAAKHGLNKLVAALEARGLVVEQADSLEAARGETIVVAGRAAASGAASALHKSLSIAPPEGAEALLIRH